MNCPHCHRPGLPNHQWKVTLASLKKELKKERDHCASWQRKASESQKEVLSLRSESDILTHQRNETEKQVAKLKQQVESFKVDKDMLKCALEDVMKKKKISWVIKIISGGLLLVVFFFGYWCGFTYKVKLLKLKAEEIKMLRDVIEIMHPSPQWADKFRQCQSDWRSQKSDIANLKEANRLLKRRIEERN